MKAKTLTITDLSVQCNELGKIILKTLKKDSHPTRNESLCSRDHIEQLLIACSHRTDGGVPELALRALEQGRLRPYRV